MKKTKTLLLGYLAAIVLDLATVEYFDRKMRAAYAPCLSTSDGPYFVMRVMLSMSLTASLIFIWQAVVNRWSKKNG